MLESLSQVTFILANWKWLALILLLLSGYLLVPMLDLLISFFKNRALKNRLLHRFLVAFLKQPIERPLAWFFTALFWKALLQLLLLPESFLQPLHSLLVIVMAIPLIRLVYLAVEALTDWLQTPIDAKTQALDQQLIPFIGKTLKVFVIVFGVLLALQNLGVNVVSLLAGLGLGGLALALAAQDTAANLFGSIMILVDRPFKVGDWIKVLDTEGTVEEIGFRSTRIRTFYNSVVTLPNSTMAKEKIDNFTLRPSRRISHELGITYETPIAKIRQFQEMLKSYLLSHPKVLKEDLSVNFNSLASYSLNILIRFHVQVSSLEEEKLIQDEFLFFCLELAQQLGVEYAYPTHTEILRK